MFSADRPSGLGAFIHRGTLRAARFFRGRPVSAVAAIQGESRLRGPALDERATMSTVWLMPVAALERAAANPALGQQFLLCAAQVAAISQSTDT
jgi:hypothetical protein